MLLDVVVYIVVLGFKEVEEEGSEVKVIWDIWDFISKCVCMCVWMCLYYNLNKYFFKDKT